MKKPFIYSATIVAIVLLALAGIWYPDWSSIWGDILKKRALIMSIVVVAVALALLLCRWQFWYRSKKQKKGSLCEKECINPDSPDPNTYPDPGWKRITEFQFKTDLCLARLKERDPRLHPEQQYIVVQDYVVYVEIDGNPNPPLKVPRGFLTDLASVPRPFRSIVGRVGLHLEAAIIHDYLYVEWQIQKCLPTDDKRLFSDKVMLAAMLASGMGCKARVIYWAIRLFGTCIFYRRNPKPWILEECKMPHCCCKSTKLEKEDAGET